MQPRSQPRPTPTADTPDPPPYPAAVSGGAVRGAKWAALALALAISGCGSANLPPAATPPPAPRPTTAPAGHVVPAGAVALARPARVAARLHARERVLEFGGATAPAGVGPTHAACLPRAWCYVTDTRGDALLVFRRTRRLELVRRYYLPGGPYGLAIDARRRLLFVTLAGRNELVELPAHGRPHVLRRWPTPRAPREVAVDGASGRVFVGAAEGVQLLRPPTRRTPPR
jgi:hypothetical protein